MKKSDVRINLKVTLDILKLNKNNIILIINFINFIFNYKQ